MKKLCTSLLLLALLSCLLAPGAFALDRDWRTTAKPQASADETGWGVESEESGWSVDRLTPPNSEPVGELRPAGEADPWVDIDSVPQDWSLIDQARLALTSIIGVLR
ncbi:hypothetical protein KQH82_10420 [bacterium]|nr:hypothetical protein [bacterium]